MTPKGFAKASSLVKGDDIFYCINSNGERFSGPYNDGEPVVANKVFDSFSKIKSVNITSVPVATKDFHGDATSIQGDIDIITANRFLGSELSYPQRLEHFNKKNLGFTNRNFAFFNSFRGLQTSLFGLRMAADGFVGISSEDPFFIKRKLRHTNFISFGNRSRAETDLMETKNNSTTRAMENLGNFQNRFSRIIKIAKIVKVDIDNFHDYVYDFETLSSLYLASGMVASNCHCYLKLNLNLTEKQLEAQRDFGDARTDEIKNKLELSK